MSTQSEMEEFYERSAMISERIQKYIRFREGVTNRIYQACQTLTQDPGNQKARMTLISNLNGERRFLVLTRFAIREGISILKKLLKMGESGWGGTINNIRDKQIAFMIIQYLLDAMEYAKKKLTAVQRRVTRGLNLEKHDYSGHHLNQFILMLREESVIDKEIEDRLRGDWVKAKDRLELLKIRITKGTVGGGVVMGLINAGVYTASSATGHSLDIAVPLIMTFSSILVVMKSISLMFTEDEEAHRRRGPPKKL